LAWEPGWCSLLSQKTNTATKIQSPLFFAENKPNSIKLLHKLLYRFKNYRFAYYRTLYAMSLLPTVQAGLTLDRDPCHYGISNIRANHNLTNNIYGNSNTNVGNVSNSYNTIIKAGVEEERSLIRTWLSPLEPDIRHRDVSNRRMDGVGDWVLRRNEFESWCGSQDGSEDPTLLCCGGQGVGKTFIR